MLPYIEKLSLKQLSTLLIREIGLLVKCGTAECGRYNAERKLWKGG